MKGFKSTGKGPKYGSFTFPSKAGFGPSSGKVKSISGYSRRAPKRVAKAVGGLAEDNIVEAPGFSDYAKGGPVRSSRTGKKYKPGKQSGHAEEKALFKKTTPVKKARGGKIPGVSDPMTAREAMSRFAKGGKVKGLAKYISQKKLIDEKNPRPAKREPMNADQRLEFQRKLGGFERTPKIGK